MRGRGWWLAGLLAVTSPACAHRVHVRESNVTTTEGNYLVPLTGTTWRVQSLGADLPLVPGVAKTALRIDREGRVVGNTGCNVFSGSAKIEGSAITFTLDPITRRECDPPIMETEAGILHALEDTRTWAMDGKYLGLLDERGHYVMKLVRAKGRIEPQRSS